MAHGEGRPHSFWQTVQEEVSEPALPADVMRQAVGDQPRTSLRLCVQAC